MSVGLNVDIHWSISACGQVQLAGVTSNVVRESASPLLAHRLHEYLTDGAQTRFHLRPTPFLELDAGAQWADSDDHALALGLRSGSYTR